MALFVQKLVKVKAPAPFRNTLPAHIEWICQRRHLPVSMTYLGVGRSHGRRRTPFKQFRCPLCGRFVGVAVDERTGRLFELFAKN